MVPGPAAIRNAAVLLARSYDAEQGGFGLAPEFPTPSHLALLAMATQRTTSASGWNACQANHITSNELTNSS